MDDTQSLMDDAHADVESDDDFTPTFSPRTRTVAYVACMVMGVERTQNLLGNSHETAVMLMYVDESGNIAKWENDEFAGLRNGK